MGAGGDGELDGEVLVDVLMILAAGGRGDGEEAKAGSIEG